MIFCGICRFYANPNHMIRIKYDFNLHDKKDKFKRVTCQFDQI